ncbi:MAG: hypothetical protein JXJ22_16915 [Bacteroidales bacterium]|nr:hypothetical protein [Bacteroidales bacterium]
MRYLFALGLGLFFTLSISGQDCTDYHQFHCTYGDYTFYYSRQSKSALFARGQTSQFQIIAYGGEDYYIAVCAHRKFGDIQFKILEDNAARSVIYDNATDDYSTSIIFANDVTRNLIIEITVPDLTAGQEKDRRCVGVVVQFRKFEERKVKR